MDAEVVNVDSQRPGSEEAQRPGPEEGDAGLVRPGSEEASWMLVLWALKRGMLMGMLAVSENAIGVPEEERNAAGCERGLGAGLRRALGRVHAHMMAAAGPDGVEEGPEAESWDTLARSVLRY